MARPRQRRESQITGPSVDSARGIELLKKQILKGRELLRSPVSKNDFDSWVLLTENYLQMVFGSDSDNVSNVLSHGRLISIPSRADEAWRENSRARRIDEMANAMESLVVLLETQAEISGSTQPVHTARVSSMSVFLVHGHDNETLQQTARFLEHLHLDVVILGEEANRGRTLIEKFEDHADVGFAVVLLTPDDVGGESAEKLAPRARQNVIFELGYFLSKLGRENVCALYVPSLEIPSDYPVLYVPVDDNWRINLAKEMKAAGLNIDMNLVI